MTQHLRSRFDTGVPRPYDIAQALLEARDPESGEPLRWQGVLDETKTFFTAGFETSATLLSWALHELSHHPDVASRHGKDPLAYLKDILTRLPRMTNHDDLLPLLPANWQSVQPTS